MKQSIQIKEFQYIYESKKDDAFFQALKEFASYKENYKILQVAKGGKALQAQQYVGTITTKNGATLEILPKISVEDDSDFSQAKDLLFKMLQSLNNSPFKKYNNSSLDIKNSPIMEIFISLFLQELEEIVKKGIIQNYSQIEGNFFFMKGKLDVAKHVQYNHAHKERFYIKFDQRLNNIAENRLIKTTLLFLNKITKRFKNKALVAKNLDIFYDVSESTNIDKDFDSCHFNRTNEYYERIIEWCRVFLARHSFGVYSGEKIAYALLFDMNELFESYVARYCKKHFANVTCQARQHNLIEQPKKYAIRPDIVIANKNDNNGFILDTKWKDYAKKDILQSDLYQLYAYGKKYQYKDVCLVYPSSENFTQAKKHAWQYDGSLNLHIFCFDCQNDVLYHNKLLDNYKK